MKQMKQESPKQRFRRLLTELGEEFHAGKEQNLEIMPTGHHCPTLLVEVSGGVVQEIRPLTKLTTPIRVIVRDYDNIKACPEAGDEVWLL